MINLVIKLFSNVPTILSNLIYFLIVFINRPLLFCISKNVWYRNSLYFKKTSLGLSDIDLTIYFENTPDKQKIDELFFIQNILKFTMGRMGEPVVYTHYDIKFFSQFINFFESKRDPFFKLKKVPSKAETFVFLTKTYLCDKANLKKYPRLRIKKWSYIFNLLNIDTKPDYKNLSFEIKEILKSFHHEYIEEDNIIFQSDLWIRYSELEFQTDWEKQLVYEQVRWEIWGLYTQRYLIKNKKQLKDHSLNLKNICHQHLNTIEGRDLMLEAISRLELSF